ncbi:MAG: Asp-tRNA(Asn)/Glu-tRNA(Gln) amidotransferase subunit GatB, partial [bacterium]|nr:Asp-tRNA(Asn)/Glu-tRNA(Gln) amidotransferase subunit GatB [bacterium]
VFDPEFADYFEKTASELGEGGGLKEKSFVTLYNYLATDLRGLMNEKKTNYIDLKFTPEHFGHLMRLVVEEATSSMSTKIILDKMFETGLDPEEILKEENLGQISDKVELEKIILDVIEKNPGPVGDFKKGKENAIQFLIGQAMARLRGRGNPTVLAEILREKLK